MERANLSGKHAAHVLNWSESKVSRMLTGRQPVKETDVSALLALCLVTGEEKERLLGLARDYNRRGWLQQYGSALPELRTLINHENRATAIYEFEPIIVPGLLQTGDYARSLFEAAFILPPKEIEPRVKARLGRQSLFSRDRQPQFTFFLHELIFWLPVGGPEVMADQMHHLLRMSVRSRITIRVIPAAAGAHASVAGACRLMEFEDLKPIVYIEEQTAGHFLEERAEIATYRKTFTALANSALSEGESQELIADLAVRLYADREDHDDSS